MEEFLGFLFDNALEIEWRQVVMWLIGGILIFLAIKKDMEQRRRAGGNFKCAV